MENNPIPFSSSNSLFEIRQLILQKILTIGTEVFINPWDSIILCVIAINPEGITQDEIIVLTGRSRTKISKSLKLFRKTGTIKIIRKPSIRKHYYQLNVPLNKLFHKFIELSLIEYQENSLFVDEILSAVLSIQKKPQISELSFFRSYLDECLELNKIVISLYQGYINHTLNLENINPQIQTTVMKKISQLIQTIFSQEPHDIKKRSSIVPPKYSIQLDAIKQSYFQKFRTLQEKTGKNSVYVSLINLLYIEKEAPNQDRLIYLTKLPRSTLSEALSKIEADGIIKAVRNSKTHTRYYYLRIPRKLILPFKIFQIIRSILELIEFFRDITHKHPEMKSDSGIIKYLNTGIREYNQIINLLLSLLLRVSEEFDLNLLEI